MCTEANQEKLAQVVGRNMKKKANQYILYICGVIITLCGHWVDGDAVSQGNRNKEKLNPGGKLQKKIW